jgi:hypothetical protein
MEDGGRKTEDRRMKKYSADSASWCLCGEKTKFEKYTPRTLRLGVSAVKKPT